MLLVVCIDGTMKDLRLRANAIAERDNFTLALPRFKLTRLLSVVDRTDECLNIK